MAKICREAEASIDYYSLFKAIMKRTPLPMTPLESLASSAVRLAPPPPTPRPPAQRATCQLSRPCGAVPGAQHAAQRLILSLSGPSPCCAGAHRPQGAGEPGGGADARRRHRPPRRQVPPDRWVLAAAPGGRGGRRGRQAAGAAPARCTTPTAWHLVCAIKPPPCTHPTRTPLGAVPILTVVVPVLTTDNLTWQCSSEAPARQCLCSRGLVPILAEGSAR